MFVENCTGFSASYSVVCHKIYHKAVSVWSWNTYFSKLSIALCLSFATNTVQVRHHVVYDIKNWISKILQHLRKCIHTNSWFVFLFTVKSRYIHTFCIRVLLATMTQNFNIWICLCNPRVKSDDVEKEVSKYKITKWVFIKLRSLYIF